MKKILSILILLLSFNTFSKVLTFPQAKKVFVSIQNTRQDSDAFILYDSLDLREQVLNEFQVMKSISVNDAKLKNVFDLRCIKFIENSDTTCSLVLNNSKYLRKNLNQRTVSFKSSDDIGRQLARIFLGNGTVFEDALSTMIIKNTSSSLELSLKY